MIRRLSDRFWNYLTDRIEARMHLRPDRDNTLDLGSSDYQWRRVYVGPGSVSAPAVTLGGDTDTGIYQSAADNLDFATGGVNRLNLSSNGLQTPGQVNMIHPSFILPLVGQPADITLTSSYQDVSSVVNLQAWNDVFSVIAGRNYPSQTGWEMCWVVGCQFMANPTTIRGALYYYDGTWQYHGTTYTKTGYAYGINYVAFGRWPLDEIAQTMKLHLKNDAGDGRVVGTDNGGAQYLLFRRTP